MPVATAIGGPSWYHGAERWLLAHGWPVLLIAAAIVIGVTAWLIVTKQAVALAGWLTYLYMP